MCGGLGLEVLVSHLESSSECTWKGSHISVTKPWACGCSWNRVWMKRGGGFPLKQMTLLLSNPTFAKNYPKIIVLKFSTFLIIFCTSKIRSCNLFFYQLFIIFDSLSLPEVVIFVDRERDCNACQRQVGDYTCEHRSLLRFDWGNHLDNFQHIVRCNCKHAPLDLAMHPRIHHSCQSYIHSPTSICSILITNFSKL